MHHVLVIGAGKIGSMISFLLAKSNDYTVYLADTHPTNPAERLLNLPNVHYHQIDAGDATTINTLINKHDIKAIISSLPYFLNVQIARIAAENNIHYFDLTEDVLATETIADFAKSSKKAFVPQCGLAPGFINIIANHLMKNFPTLDTVKMRVGALPINISNALQYSLTWSTDGLINEYGNLCPAIENNKLVSLLPLEGLEVIKIDGLTYEAFNTSGGIGSMANTCLGKVKHLSYKTIRYPGHCEKIKFLMNDLKLNADRNTLKHILEQALPKTYQDVVLVYVSVTGLENGRYLEESYVKKFYSKNIDGHRWSAIQLTTASSLCSIVDLILAHPDKYHGYVRQEQFEFDDFINNRFGKYFL